MKRKSIHLAVAVVAVVGCLQAMMSDPVVNIGKRHGELRAAQEAIVSSFAHISTAQANNSDELGGHAAKAKEYLIKADAELRLAADVANRR
ncbi:hypothetical protein [Paludibaculum fermentans]|uniref:Lipoprotein n=1 Tax=Paludibaculum fermentans TaxID=1473598 RepID=A0A7S7NLI4_PALFE|nr:hypothetical protein [Paludibaculum fermentans]QOY85857.1 hypothetical protein IRI77_23955 [Paludibaculum fermentans]